MRLIVMVLLAVIMSGCAVISVEPPKLANAGIPSDFNANAATLYIDYQLIGLHNVTDEQIRQERVAELKTFLHGYGFRNVDPDEAEYVLVVQEKEYEEVSSLSLLFLNCFSAQIIPALWDAGSALTYEVKQNGTTISNLTTSTNVNMVSGLAALLLMPLSNNDKKMGQARTKAHESVLADLIDQGVFE